MLDLKTNLGVHVMNIKKAEVIDAFFEKGMSLRKIARDLGVDKMVISSWIEIYRFHGMEGLMAPACKGYEESFKIHVIQHMIETAEPYSKVAGRFNIPSRATIWKWMHQYMSEEEWTLYYLKRERRDMKKKQPKQGMTDIGKLQEELEYLRAENAYLKKLDALVQEKKKSQPKRK
jgi:transposase